MQSQSYHQHYATTAPAENSPQIAGQQRHVPRTFFWLSALAVGSSFYVVVEPAPSDLLFLVLFIAVLYKRGIQFPLDLNPVLSTAWLIFIVMSALSLLRAEEPTRAIFFYSVTMYLVVTWYVVVTLLANYGQAMWELVLRAFLAAAAIAAAIGLGSHFFPELQEYLYLRPYGQRATGTFKDPNVYSPFLCAGLVLLINLLVTRRWRFSLTALLAVGLLCLYTAEFVGALSRGAFVSIAVSLAVYFSLELFVVRRRSRLLRFSVLICVGTLMILPVVSIYLDATGLKDLLTQRIGAQEYDAERFGVQALVLSILNWAPLGIGPGQSEVLLPTAPHNLYLLVLLENGIFAAFAFYTFLAVTLGICFRNALRRRSAFQDVYICCTAILAGMLVNSLVIDSLHWRHFFLFLAIPIGLARYERRRARSSVAARVAATRS
jgi:O-antigen ligase